MPRLPMCRRCQHNAHSVYLVCAIHPDGPNSTHCPDFTSNKDEQSKEWVLDEVSDDSGEMLLPSEVVSRVVETSELLGTHPLFTGRCPQCGRVYERTDHPQMYWDCEECGWIDDSV